MDILSVVCICLWIINECLWVAFLRYWVHVGCMRVKADWASKRVFVWERGFLNPSVITVNVCFRRETESITSRCWRKSRNSLNNVSFVSTHQRTSQSGGNSGKSDLRKFNLLYNNIYITQQLPTTRNNILDLWNPPSQNEKWKEKRRDEEYCCLTQNLPFSWAMTNRKFNFLYDCWLFLWWINPYNPIFHSLFSIVVRQQLTMADIPLEIHNGFLNCRFLLLHT